MTPSVEKWLDTRAVRSQCRTIGRWAELDETRWFQYHSNRLPACIEFVADECKRNYPDLNIPYHSRWRHFDIGGVDLWHYYRDRHLSGAEPAAVTRCAIDLVFVSVLLDAGAGSEWRFIDPVTGESLIRSEGLAAASVDLFFNHLARRHADGGLIVDAAALDALTADTLKTVFQVDSGNALVGVEGRLELLKGLGACLIEQSLDRPADAFSSLLQAPGAAEVSADHLLSAVLQHFNAMWPNGLNYLGSPLGDAGFYPHLDDESPYGTIVPFHKLSQWLTYSLFEPIEWAGLIVSEKDGLTGLPEYRNGGLLLDMGVLTPIDASILAQKLPLESEPVVEWRALTVWLLDEIAQGVRDMLGCDPAQLPLASVLQGGTWSAGRRIASSLRPDGSPPLNLAIDGTVF
ncbi:MAG: DUF1688 family protein [Pseudomonadota bacterium]